MDDASPEVLSSIGGAPNIHDRLHDNTQWWQANDAADDPPTQEHRSTSVKFEPSEQMNFALSF